MDITSNVNSRMMSVMVIDVRGYDPLFQAEMIGREIDERKERATSGHRRKEWFLSDLPETVASTKVPVRLLDRIKREFEEFIDERTVILSGKTT